MKNLLGKGVLILGYTVGIGYVFKICTAFSDVALVNKHLKKSKGMTTDEIITILNARMSSKELDEYFRMKAKELRGRKLKDGELKKLLRYDSIVSECYKSVPVS